MTRAPATLLALVALASLAGRAEPQEAPAPAPAPAAGEVQPEWSPEERAAIELLRSLRKKERPSDEQLATRLSAAGPRLLSLYASVLVSRRVPAPAQGEPQILSEVQERALLAACGRFDRDTVLRHVETALLPSREPAVRAAALGLLGAVGHANDLPQMLACALAKDEAEPDQRLLRALRDATAAVLARDPRAVEQLVSLRRLTRPELLQTLVEAVGAAREPRGLAYLAEIVYWHEDLVLTATTQVPLLGPSGDAAIDDVVRVRLRPLLDEARPAPCRAAVLALTALGDTDSIGALIELLGSENAGLRENAHWALQRLTGLTLAAQEEPWARWHQGELYWLVRSKARQFQLLREKDPAVVTRALREILGHPLARAELATALPELLKSHTPALRVLACRTLADVGAHGALEPLVWALQDSEVEVVAAAHAALCTLTQRDLPRDPEAVKVALAAGAPDTQL